MFEEKLKEFEPIFYPKSIAVVGASATSIKAGSLWVENLRSAGFPGLIYPVGSSGGRIGDLKILPSLRLIPGEVDYVIVAVPRQSALELLDDCAAKNVKAVHFFTAGFSETDTQQGRKLEEQMLDKARQGNMRIIGPNCIGVYCPEHRIPLLMGILGENGSVGFVSQSGGIATKLVTIGIARHINYSKGVSFGNGIDLDASDFLQYMAADPKTKVIGAYLEGTRDGTRLFKTMRKVAEVKPLVVWKGGRTEAGAQAALSHTGSLASSAAVWSAALKQAGAIEVHSLEELTDTLLIFQQFGHGQGIRAAIIGGLADGGGGNSVAAGDACIENGLQVPPLSFETKRKLSELLGEVGGILCNPIDVSQAQFRGLATLFQAIDLIVKDTIGDVVLIQEDTEILLPIYSQKGLEEINEFFIELAGRQNKPVIVVLPPGSVEANRLRIEQRLLEASIPVFGSMERAARAICRLNQYSCWQEAK
ncbi:MAG: CoA-binding protein [Dehalococcoidia bacterium]|nr:CoA-binding protein [Dehalococcoidia bacterium]MDH4299118.1 CoA-binding protein [Dehalococcoidia bacterium]MDH4366513.1 CoA-binding protein [Dehalococcoidia bacterium]